MKCFSFPAKLDLFTSVTCSFLQFLPLLVIYMHWNSFFRKDDGVKVVSVENLKNPYEKQENFNMRFKLTLNKLYAWSLVSYERVVMLDSDNIFLQNTDELFQCGQFCAVFINPCIFHTGLFVLQVELLTLHAFHFLQKKLTLADQKICYFCLWNGYKQTYIAASDILWCPLLQHSGNLTAFW